MNIANEITEILHIDICIPGRSRFWSRPPPPSPPPETVLFPEATDHNFERIVFIFGIHLWGVKVSPPIENGQGWVISPGVGGQKPPKLSTFSYFSLCGLKIFCLIHLFCFICVE
jgi:hypothetical protein